ncbi:hypothetical protein FBZ88_12273 [Nitrospirillum bahiense]|uniref:Uncharacterized protein n=1 Tax=Nitrospirillum amazonense TaxID=28077 RepID=A0A560FC75_9PROT|nr:hypothetical protein FBZ88_12273 [Nitrospirillum amazonense]
MHTVVHEQSCAGDTIRATALGFLAHRISGQANYGNAKRQGELMQLNLPFCENDYAASAARVEWGKGGTAAQSAEIPNTSF